MSQAGGICPRCGQYVIKNGGRAQGDLYCPNGCDLFTVQTPDYKNDRRMGQDPLGASGCYVKRTAHID